MKSCSFNTLKHADPVNRFFFQVIILCIIVSQAAKAQKIQAPERTCATMQALEQRMQTDPSFDRRYQSGILQYKQSVNQQAILSEPVVFSAPVIIPVIVHIVLPQPQLVTDDDVAQFINRLNEDFSGTNADSTNATNYYAVRGHSMLRFALARRDPQGNPTTGIERRSAATPIGNGEPQALKNNNTGGLNPWPMTDYYNIWIGAGVNGVIGIAPDIGPGTAATDGVCIDYRVFTRNACYTKQDFNLSRTAVHEIAHNFGLYHIFEGNCSGTSDFGQLTSMGLSYPPSYLDPMDDTPRQSDATNGCPAGIINSGCGSGGRMYQNFMDYTNDACYSMFTKGQVERMHWVVQNGRTGYLSAQGHLPPSGAPAYDASLDAVINPGGSNYTLNTCNSYPAPTCPGNLTPGVRIINRGLNNLTSINVVYQLNNKMPVTKSFSLNLLYGQSQVVWLEDVYLDYGNNDLKFYTQNPNGNPDQQPQNDTLTKNIFIANSVTASFAEGFEDRLLPTGWNIVNNGDYNTWQLAGVGKNSSKSAFIDNYNFESYGQEDDLVLIPVTTTGMDSLVIEFELAHKNYPGSADKLSVLISTDCGKSTTLVYSKSGDNLSTAGSSTESFTQPGIADWRKERIAVGGDILKKSQAQIIFRNTNDFGNNIFIDDIKISSKLLPQRLKDDGVLILPNPFKDQFSIWHYQQPVSLKAVGVYNVFGQKIWQQSYQNNAGNTIPVNLSRQAPGLYLVQLLYTDPMMNTTIKVVKQ